MNTKPHAFRTTPHALCGIALILFALVSFIFSGTTQADKGSLSQDERLSSRQSPATPTQSAPGGSQASGKGGDIQPTASSGSTSLYMINGGGSGSANGDYLSTTMDSSHRFFIEVPPGLSNFQVDIFDADIGAGGSTEDSAGRDRARNTTFNTAAQYTLIDPSGTSRPVSFTTGNNTSPTGADNQWLTFFASGTGNTVADNFGTAAYNNSNGNSAWATNWIEAGDGGGSGSPTGGDILITGGELRLQGDGGTLNITRQADLLGTPGLNLTTAFLSFSYRTSGNLDDADQMSVQVSTDGTNWTTLETFSNDSSGSRSYNITSSIDNDTRIRFSMSGNFDADEFFFVDNVQISDAGVATAGHWELRINMSASFTGGDDINAFGIRAHDGTSGSGGTELPIYADSIIGLGINPVDGSTAIISRTYALYPYVTSGCSCSENDFDYDTNSGDVGQAVYTGRTGTFSRTITEDLLSANDVWARNTLSGYTSDSSAIDYGLWTANVTIRTYNTGGGSTVNGNYNNYYIGSFQNPNPVTTPPTVNPIASAFRIYLPTDGGVKPVKPYLTQTRAHFSGPTPPQVNQTSVYTIQINMVNPTTRPIVFSASNLVTANIPAGGGATYAGNATGGVVTQPAVNGTGNITFNPGTVAAGATATMTYRVNVTPTSAGQRVVMTGTPASNGTRAQYVDETGNTSQSRATYLFGPLCELAVTQDTLTAVDEVTGTATEYDGGVLLEWQTGFEVNNLGFNIYREESGKRQMVSREMVAGSALLTGPDIAVNSGASYSWWDAGAKGTNTSYWIEDIDLGGKSVLHGPFYARTGAGKAPVTAQAASLSSYGASAASESELRASQDDATRPVEQTARKVKRATGEQVALQASAASSDSSVKLLVRREGWYRVTGAELAAAGFDTGAVPQMLRLFADGQEVPVKVTADEKGQLGASSAVEFYGYGLNTTATDARAYYLVAGSETGKRIELAPTFGLSGKIVPAASSFTHTVERKDRTIYFSALQNGERENFFGAVVAPAGVNQTLTLSRVELSSASAATVEVALQGVTQIPHRVRVEMNGVTLGEISYNNMSQGLGKFALAHAQLLEGTNTVRLTSLGGTSDVNLVDYIRVSYQHAFKADNDSLTFAANGGERVIVGGFTSKDIRVYDVTTAEVKEVSGEIAEGAGSYTVTVTAPDKGARRLLALTPAQAKTVAAMRLNHASSWKSAANSADLIIITARAFFPAVEALSAARKQEGYTPALVDVEDLYDEFSFGHKSPQAVRDFLAYAKSSWKVKPRFVLLVGDATYDSKNYLGVGDVDIVPTKLVDTAFLETASDDWFSDFNNDGIADLPTGRLPVRLAQEAATLIGKLLSAGGASKGMQQSSSSVLLVSDANDNSFNFEQASEQLRSFLPEGIEVADVRRGQLDAATAKARLYEALSSGQSLVNYAGHGSVGLWRGNLLTTPEAKALTNQKLPLFVLMTCLNGYFHEASADSLAEGLLKAERGGALAVWASSGQTYPQEQALINQELYRLLLGGDAKGITIGEAVNQAKTKAADMDIRRTWTLLGDPTSRLR